MSDGRVHGSRDVSRIGPQSMTPDAAVDLGRMREQLRRAVLALHVPPLGFAYRRWRAEYGDERFALAKVAHRSGPVFIFRCDAYGLVMYRVLDACGLELQAFRKLASAKACADEYGPVLDGLFARAAEGDTEAADMIPAIAGKHRQRERQTTGGPLSR